MKKIILATIFIMMIAFGDNVYAYQDKTSSVNFKRIEISDGLSQGTIQDIMQDSDGYIWFATEDGLNKYDGIDFEFYRYSEESSKGLASNWIMDITEDNSGYIWVSTTNGVNTIETSTGVINTYTEKEGLSDNSITQIFIDSKNRVIICTEDGINLYNKKENKFERILYDKDSKILTSQNIVGIQEDSNGVYWIATDKGLNSYNTVTGKVDKYLADGSYNSISDNSINSIFLDDEDVLWISTRYGGLNKLNIKTGKIDVFKNDENNNNSIPSNYVNCVMKDNSGRIWVGTKGGLSLFDDVTDTFKTYKNKMYDSISLIDNDVISLYQDRGNIIWIGTSKGVSYFNPDGIFNLYKNDPFDRNTISGDMIFGIYEDDNGFLWVGTTDNGVNVIDRENNKVYRLDEIEEAKKIFSSNRISDINGIGEVIWIATLEELIYINLSTKEIKKFFENEGKELLNIYIDKDGLVWIAESSGLYSIDSEFNIKSYDEEFFKNNIKDKYVSTVFQDSKGIMWIGLGVNGGLLKYNRETGIIKQYKNIEDDKNSLSYNSVKDINEDSKGNIWIATNYGLNKYNEDEDNFTRYTESDGLSNNFVYKILIDDDDNLWLSTNHGISRYDIEKDKFVNLGITNGLQGNEFNKNAGFKSKSGEMFFGGISGLNSFFPDKFKESKTPAEIVIDKISINGNYINEYENVNLKYNDNHLRIEYFLPDYSNSKKVMYSYKLEGVDKDWILAKNSRVITYNNLEAGSYKLLIKAKNSFGVTSDIKEINIHKDLPPWKTPYAYFIYVTSIIIIIYLIWNRVKLLDKMVKIRTIELNKQMEENDILYRKTLENEINKNNYFVNLSHELRTPLNLILSTQQLISNLNKGEDNIPKEKINYYMEVLKNNSKRLLNLINNIIDTSKIESGHYKMNIEEHDIVYHIESTVFDMKDFIESKGIEFIVDPKVEELIVKCDINDIEKCIINIIGNAVKFTDEGGKIEVLIDEVDDNVEIRIKDTGIGIAEQDLEGIFNRFGQAYNKKSEEFGGSGIGLTLTKQLIELHHGKLLVESKVGVGSTFIIILPKG
ncbi:sensor histidine kinase [Clostridium sp. D53t1_180928_C8]|uniref:two-component regulator propeller domain-containing protein n=1 Tax=Clostridium sp. D53t1_180928_C8 TaxID=2787101 RepID=UPI0018ABE054